jgi:hypothetical protein
LPSEQPPPHAPLLPQGADDYRVDHRRRDPADRIAPVRDPALPAPQRDADRRSRAGGQFRIQVVQPGEGVRDPVPLESLGEYLRLGALRQQRRVGQHPAQAEGERADGVGPGQPVPDIEVQVVDRPADVVTGVTGRVQHGLDALGRRHSESERGLQASQVGVDVGGQRARLLVRGHRPDPGQVRRQRPVIVVRRRTGEAPAVVQLGQQPAEAHREAYRVLRGVSVSHGPP